MDRTSNTSNNSFKKFMQRKSLLMESGNQIDKKSLLDDGDNNTAFNLPLRHTSPLL